MDIYKVIISNGLEYDDYSDKTVIIAGEIIEKVISEAKSIVAKEFHYYKEEDLILEYIEKITRTDNNIPIKTYGITF